MSPSQLNIEWLFLLIYNLLFGGDGSVSFSAFAAFLSNLWLWIIFIGYLLSIIAFFVIIYVTIRIFELRRREHEFYTTLIVPPDAPGGMHPRWTHIQELLDAGTPSVWREAIIEADIMLDDLLTEKGYVGAGVGEKLKTADESTIHTIQNAWEAHKVRNRIAHDGSAFELSETLVNRTMAHFESVFREFGVI